MKDLAIENCMGVFNELRQILFTKAYREYGYIDFPLSLQILF